MAAGAAYATPQAPIPTTSVAASFRIAITPRMAESRVCLNIDAHAGAGDSASKTIMKAPGRSRRYAGSGAFAAEGSRGPIETFRIFEYEPTTTPTIELLLRRVHPDDRALLKQVLDKAANDGANF